MKANLSAICRRGGREYNQDAQLSYINKDTVCAVVCDGLGSYHGSEIISAAAAEYIVSAFKKLNAQNAEKSFERMNILKIYENTQAHITDIKSKNYALHSSCTTVAAAFMDGNNILFTHIGDSRILLFRQNKLVYRTIDHSMAQMAVECGLIQSYEIRKHPDQNKLTRVLGSDYYIAPDMTYVDQPIQAGDSVILCTDGFWEYVFDEDMEQALAASKDSEEALSAMEKSLSKRAGKQNDNYTAIVIKFSE